MKWSDIIAEAATVTETKAVTLFHASPHAIQQFAPLTHFGSRAAALQRAGNTVYHTRTMYLYEVVLSASHPLRIRDLTSKQRSANHTWSNITDLLHYTVKKISAVERDAIYAAAAPSATNAAGGTAKLIDLLHGHGWDALVYKNVFEDAGSQSWINLMSAQVRILHISPIEHHSD
jgi:hypothetical protein